VFSAPDEPCMIKANQTEISQVLINLCTNSVYAMEDEPGTIEISLNMIEHLHSKISDFPDLKSGKYAELVIADTGCGIEPWISKRMFDPYFTTKAIGQGVGMGLAVVHGIIKGHKGFIAVQSKKGQGTRVTIHLPLIESEPSSRIEMIKSAPQKKIDQNR